MFLLYYLFVTSIFFSKISEKKWLYIFNGKNLDGWEIKIRGHKVNDNFKNTFKVKNDILEVSYNDYDQFDDKFGHIFYTLKEFQDYHLSLEYRFFSSHLSGAPSWSVKNSGIMIHSQSPYSMLIDQEFPVSVEAQLLGGIDRSKSRNTLNMCSPGTEVFVDGMIASSHCVNSKSKTYYSDDWIKAEVIVYSDSIIHHIIDLDTVLSYSNIMIGGEYTPQNLKNKIGKNLKKGFISLQSEGHPIQFKNIKIKPL